ncbi:MAG TPA: hypothetical protein V6C72_03455 [Chroococcales cyanobacterium]
MSKRKSKRGAYEIEDMGDVALPSALDAKIQSMIAAADTEIDATRVNFRWQREPLSLIKEVALAMGIPYQTYIKQVLYKQALDDMAKILSTQGPRVARSPVVSESLAPGAEGMIRSRKPHKQDSP